MNKRGGNKWTFQKLTDCGESSPTDTSYMEEGAGSLQEPGYQEICHETVLSRNGCTNKIRTMTILIDILTWMGNFSWSPTPRQRTTIIDFRKKENYPLLVMRSFFSCLVQSDQLWYTPPTKKNVLRSTMHICIRITKKKRQSNWTWRDIQEGFEGR